MVVADGRRLALRPIDGSDGTVVELPAPAQDPAFSPDGRRLVYSSEYQLFTVGVDGGAVRRLTATGTVNGEPTWTADGDWIVFRSNRTGAGDLYVVRGDAAGGDEKGLALVSSANERDVTPSF